MLKPVQILTHLDDMKSSPPVLYCVSCRSTVCMIVLYAECEGVLPESSFVAVVSL